MIDKILEEEVMKAVLVDIDVQTLAKKFKPIMEKKIESELKEFVQNYEFDYDDWYDLMFDIFNKSIKPEIRKQFGLTKGKK